MTSCNEVLWHCHGGIQGLFISVTPQFSVSGILGQSAERLLVLLPHQILGCYGEPVMNGGIS